MITFNPYDEPKIIDTQIFEDRIEVIYKCEVKFHTHKGNNYPKIYKEIYNRNNGSMKKIDGTFIPEQHYKETYKF